MSSISVENYQFYLIDGRNRKTAVLKYYDPLSNGSSLPMYETNDGNKFPLFDMLSSIMADFDRISDGVCGGLDKIEVQLALLLVTKVLLTKHRDYKVLEIGCDNGVLSFALARLLRSFNPNNRLVCAASTLSTESFRHWHDTVPLSGAADIVSLVSADYSNLPLPRNGFDIVVVNGSAPFAEPAGIILSAMNLARVHGLLVCVSASQYLLTSCFQVFVDHCKEYYLSSAASILTKTLDPADKRAACSRTDEYKFSAIKQDVGDAVAVLKETIQSLSQPGRVSNSALDTAIRLAARAEDDILAVFNRLNSLDIKFNINELKEALISCRLSRDEADRACFAAQCREKYQAVIDEMGRYSDW